MVHLGPRSIDFNRAEDAELLASEMEATPGILPVRQRSELSSPSFRGARVEPAFEVHPRESNTVTCALNSPLGRGCGVLTLCVLVRCEQVTRPRQGARCGRALCAHAQHRHRRRDRTRARRVRRTRSAMLASQDAPSRRIGPDGPIWPVCCALERICAACGVGVRGLARRTAAHSCWAN